MMGNPFDGIESAQYTERGIHLEAPGAFICQIDRCLFKMTQKAGPAFIVEFELLESSHPNHPAREKRIWYQNMSQKAVAHGMIKAFAIACSGARYDRVDPTFLQALSGITAAACDQRNILQGMQLGCMTSAKAAKPGAKVPFYTVYTWLPLPMDRGAGQSAEILRRFNANPQANPYPQLPMSPPMGGQGFQGQPPAQQWGQPQGFQGGPPPMQQPAGPPAQQWGQPQGFQGQPPAQQWGQPQGFQGQPQGFQGPLDRSPAGPPGQGWASQSPWGQPQGNQGWGGR